MFKSNNFKFIKWRKNSNNNQHISKNVNKDNPYILKVKNLTMKFKNFVALDNVSFNLKKCERIALIGGNGAGKTTISEIIVGINKPTSGKIEYGFDFKSKPQERIGMQFQSCTYPSGLTVKDIIAFSRNIHNLKFSNKDIKEFLKTFQMEDFYSRPTRSLSGGQRQKINILMSILHKPKILILDEFSTGLDISAREDIINFTNKLLKDNEMSAILISHHTEEIKAICTHVIVLDHGKIVGSGSIKDIEKEYGSLEEYMKKTIKTGIQENNKDVQRKFSNNLLGKLKRFLGFKRRRGV